MLRLSASLLKAAQPPVSYLGICWPSLSIRIAVPSPKCCWVTFLVMSIWPRCQSAGKPSMGSSSASLHGYRASVSDTHSTLSLEGLGAWERQLELSGQWVSSLGTDSCASLDIHRYYSPVTGCSVLTFTNCSNTSLHAKPSALLILPILSRRGWVTHHNSASLLSLNKGLPGDWVCSRLGVLPPGLPILQKRDSSTF